MNINVIFYRLSVALILLLSSVAYTTAEEKDQLLESLSEKTNKILSLKKYWIKAEAELTAFASLLQELPEPGESGESKPKPFEDKEVNAKLKLEYYYSEGKWRYRSKSETPEIPLVSFLVGFDGEFYGWNMMEDTTLYVRRKALDKKNNICFSLPSLTAIDSIFGADSVQTYSLETRYGIKNKVELKDWETVKRYTSELPKFAIEQIRLLELSEDAVSWYINPKIKLGPAGGEDQTVLFAINPKSGLPVLVLNTSTDLKSLRESKLFLYDAKGVLNGYRAVKYGDKLAPQCTLAVKIEYLQPEKFPSEGIFSFLEYKKVLDEETGISIESE